MTRNHLLQGEAKCGNGESCPRRETCVRWIAPASGQYQVWAAFYVAGAECDAYWSTQTGAA
jgi:hypothetical protein